jgi:hybrid cluster-associated redox disulfide protein
MCEYLMTDSEALAEMTIDDVLTRWPQTADVFTRRNMACVGCPVAPFYTVSEAAAIYNLEISDFIDELQQAVAKG